MKYITTCIIFLLFISNSFAQNKQPEVSIKEKKIGKRLELYAVNMKDKSYKVTLNVYTQDYKRASDAPIVKKIPPHTAIKMITMIQIDDTPGIYSYDIVIGEIGYEIALKGNKKFDKKINAALKNKNITLYTKPNCALCSDTKYFLKRNRVLFKERSVISDSLSLKKMITNYDAHTSYLPILKIQDSVYSNIKSDRDIAVALSNHM